MPHPSLLPLQQAGQQKHLLSPSPALFSPALCITCAWQTSGWTPDEHLPWFLTCHHLYIPSAQTYRKYHACTCSFQSSVRSSAWGETCPGEVRTCLRCLMAGLYLQMWCLSLIIDLCCQHTGALSGRRMVVSEGVKGCHCRGAHLFTLWISVLCHHPALRVVTIVIAFKNVYR